MTADLAGRALVIVVAGFMLAGCTDAPAVPEAAREPRTEDARLIIHEPVHVRQGTAAEPMIVKGPGGTLWVTGYGSEFAPGPGMLGPALWRSDDGEAWSRVEVGLVLDGAIGWSDSDLAVADDGTVYLTSMAFVFGTCPAAVEGCPAQLGWFGAAISVGASSDGGATWTWTTVAAGVGVDRPWVDVGPDGIAHLIWNDGEGVHHASSADSGTTWRDQGLVHEAGGSGSLAVGPTGELAVRVTPGSENGRIWDADVDGVAVSLDAGASWTWHDLPGEREARFVGDPAQGVPRWVEPVAFDEAGTLYTCWSAGTHMVVARSPDLGATWTTFDLPPGNAAAYYPFMAGGGPGHVAMSWFEGAAGTLQARVAAISFDGDNVTSGTGGFGVAPRPDAAPVGHGEYFGVTFLEDGTIGLVNTVPANGLADSGGFSFRLAEVG